VIAQRSSVVVIGSVLLLGSVEGRADPPTQASATSAQLTEGMEDLAELDLVKLLSTTIRVASKKDELLLDAPGTVTIFTDRDLRTMGYFALKDLASITPGYSAIRDAEASYILETRGMVAGLGEKHLVLIDGMPINHPRHNSAVVEEELPLLFASRVEFLRGPASALYGTGAFNGVINVVSAEREEEGTTVQGHLGIGLQDPGVNPEGVVMLSRRLMAGAIHRSAGSDVKLAFGHHGAESALDRTGPGSSNPFRDSQHSLFLYYDQKLREGPLAGLAFGFLYMDRISGYGEGWARASPNGGSDVSNQHQFQSILPYLKYQTALGDSWRFNARLRTNFGREKGSQANTVGWWTGGMPGVGTFQYDVLTNNVEGLAELAWDITSGGRLIKSSDLITGVDYDVRWQSKGRSWTEASLGMGAQPLYDKKGHTFSGYLQWSLVFPVLADLKLTSGVRADSGYLDGETYFNLSPRLALVQKVNDWLSCKLMYGTALKAPGIDAYSHNAEKKPLFDADNLSHGTSYTLSDLSAETIQTIEVAVAFRRSRTAGSIGLFYNETSNELRRSYFFTGFQSDYFQNVPGHGRALGAEAELVVLPLPNWRLTANVAHARARDEAKKPYPEVPITKVNLVTDYTFGGLGNLNVAAIGKGVTSYTSTARDAMGNLPVGYEADRATLVLDATAHLPVTSGLTFGLELRNLLGRTAAPYWPNGLTPRSGRLAMLTFNGQY
jgi:outer membrane receptor for ferrienterochelin and colicins